MYSRGRDSVRINNRPLVRFDKDILKTIYKYNIPITDRFSLSLPEDSKVIFVGIDPKLEPCIWVEFDYSDKDLKTKTFRLFGTGHPIDDDSIKHIGSFVQDRFVWHLYGE